MKKFLSLVLALVMTMSLVTVSAGAADFKDADSIEYKEAVEVLDLIGVLEGYPDGSFQPKTVLTRAQAATIIAKLILTPDLATELTVEAAPFADVPASHWAAAYIAEGVEQGILAGMGDGTFAPDAQLTGYQFLKMLFVALGYDAATEGLTGANYTIGVTKLNKDLKLTDGNDKFVGKNPVTREEAALYVWNAMNTEQVYYEDAKGGVTITVGEVVIDTAGNAGDAKGNGDFWSVAYDLETASKADDFGRDGYYWFVDEDGDAKFDKDDEEKTAVISEAATEIFVAEKAYGKTEMDKFLEDNDLEDVKGMDFDEDGIAMGEVVELWIKKDKVVDFITYTYASTTVTKVTEMSAKKNSDEVDHGISAKYTFSDYAYLDGTYVDAFEECDDEDCKFCDKNNFVVIGEWEEDDVILLTVNQDDEAVVYDEIESVYGEIESKKAGKYIVVDGEKLYTADTAAYAYEKNYTVYVDPNGYVVSNVEGKPATGETEEKEYVYLMAAEFDAGASETLFKDGEDPAAKVKVMYLDGEIEVADYCVFENEDEEWVFEFAGKEIEATAAKFNAKVVEGKWYSYEEHDGMICLEAADAEETLKVSDSRTWSVGRVDGETELVKLDKKGVYETYTGRADMPTEELKNVLVITEKGIVVAAYAYEAKWTESAEELNDVAVLLEKGDEVKEGLTVTFIVGEEEVEYVVDTKCVSVLNDKHAFYEILTEDDGVVTIAKIYAEELVKGEVTYIEDEYVELVGGVNFDLADDCEIYQLNKKLDSVTAIDELAKEDVVIVMNTNKKDEATLVYVFALNTVDGFTAK